MVSRSICHSEGLDPEIEPLATLIKEVLGDRVCRAVRVITSSLGDEYIRLNGLVKIMKEKIDWEENVAHKIADAELSMEIERGNCYAKTDLKDLATKMETWCFGRGTDGASVLADATQDVPYLLEIRELVVKEIIDA